MIPTLWFFSIVLIGLHLYVFPFFFNLDLYYFHFVGPTIEFNFLVSFLWFEKLSLSSCLEWRSTYPLLEDAGLETWAIDILGWGFSDLGFVCFPAIYFTAEIIVQNAISS